MSKKQEQQKLSQWRWYRNKVISLLCEAGLKPSQIVMLRYCELYKESGKPAKMLVMRPEVGRVGGRKNNVVRLSKKLQRNLSQLYEPILFSSRGFCIPVITDRPIARALTQEHVGRIVRRMYNDKMTQTQLGAAMEQMIEDDDPIINETLNAQ